MQLPIKTIRDAVQEIRDYLGELSSNLDNHKLISFDYETSTLKPQSDVKNMSMDEWEIFLSNMDDMLSHIESSTYYIPMPVYDESVDLFARRYSWTCHECSTIYEEIEAKEIVMCKKCHLKFKVDEVNHSYRSDAPKK